MSTHHRQRHRQPLGCAVQQRHKWLDVDQGGLLIVLSKHCKHAEKLGDAPEV